MLSEILCCSVHSLTIELMQLKLEPLWENNKSCQTFITKQVLAFVTAFIAFAVGILMQIWAVSKERKWECSRIRS